MRCVYWALIRIPLLILRAVSFNTSKPLAFRASLGCHDALDLHVASAHVALPGATITVLIELVACAAHGQTLLDLFDRSPRHPGGDEDRR